MVLCPFVYLQLRYDLPPLALQPSEVHSAYWVPLGNIVSPSLKREVRCDVSDRFTQQRIPLVKMMLRATFGQLVFGAVKLKPTESIYSDSASESALEGQAATYLGSFKTLLGNRNQSDADDQPLLLWGLTLAIMADVLEIIDRPATSKLWNWPTFSPWDMRAVIWLLNHKFQSRKIQELTASNEPNHRESDDIQLGGLDNTTYSTSIKRPGKGSEAGVAGMTLLADYSQRLRQAAIVALCLRFFIGATFSAFLIRRYGHRLR